MISTDMPCLVAPGLPEDRPLRLRSGGWHRVVGVGHQVDAARQAFDPVDELLDGGAGQRSTVLVALKERPWLTESKDGPRLHLYDEADNLRAALGSISLQISETGMVIKRSPSSLVLFDKEGKVIWRTPQD